MRPFHVLVLIWTESLFAGIKLEKRRTRLPNRLIYGRHYTAIDRQRTSTEQLIIDALSDPWTGGYSLNPWLALTLSLEDCVANLPLTFSITHRNHKLSETLSIPSRLLHG